VKDTKLVLDFFCQKCDNKWQVLNKKGQRYKMNNLVCFNCKNNHNLTFSLTIKKEIQKTLYNENFFEQTHDPNF